MKVSIVIPARLASSRLSRKILRPLAGQPLLKHTWERALKATSAHEVIIAVDDIEVKDLVEGWGATAILTDPNYSSGTERIVSILDQIKGDFIINLQADEPFINPSLLDDLVAYSANSDIITPIYKFKTLEDLESPNNPKVVIDQAGNALYFSRSVIPYIRGVEKDQWLTHNDFWWHIGVYGYQRHVLENYHALPSSKLEVLEKLEQLKFLDAGYKIKTIESFEHFLSVDTQADLDKAEQLLSLQPL